MVREEMPSLEQQLPATAAGVVQIRRNQGAAAAVGNISLTTIYADNLAR